jgi:PIN domain nuclease of toxin-antitoxin system
MYLADTNIVIRLLLEQSKLSSRIKHILLDTDVRFHFSAAVPWEITIKSNQAKLTLEVQAVYAALIKMDWKELVIDSEDAMAAAALPLHRRDPFDRVMIAQARRHSFTILTSDIFFDAYDVAVVRG